MKKYICLREEEEEKYNMVLLQNIENKTDIPRNLVSKTTKDNIEALGIVEEYTQRVGTTAYVWGGFIADIYIGKIMRNHDDSENLVLNLYDHIEELKDLFKKNDWKTKILENGDLNIIKGNAKVQLGHLEIIDKTARWFHNGQKGAIEFPSDWLNRETVKFLNIKVHAVLPEFQYVLKKKPYLLNLEKRKKDIEDIERLELILAKRYKNTSIL